MGMLRPVVLSVVCLLLAASALAQSGNGGALAQGDPLSGWEAQLSAVERELAEGTLDRAEQARERSELSRLTQEAGTQAEVYAGQVQAAQNLLKALGPAPEEGAPAEPESTQAERRKLNEELARAQAAKSRADLVVAKAELLLRQLDQVRIDTFTQEMLTQEPNLLSGATWAKLPASLSALEAAVGARLTERNVQDDARRNRRLLFGAAALLVLAGGLPLSRWLQRRLERRRQAGSGGEAPYRHRVLAALIETLLRFFIPFVVVLFLLFVVLTLAGGSSWQPLVESLAIAAAAGASLAVLLIAAGKAILVPAHARWRLLALSDASALALYRRWLVASAMFGVILTVRYLMRDLQPGPVIGSLVHGGQAILGTLILLSLLPAHLWLGAGDGETAAGEEASGDTAAAWLGQARYLRFATLLVALAVLGAALFGYQVLSDYVALLFLSGVALGFLLVLLRGALRDGLHSLLFERRRTVEWRRILFKSERGANFFELVACFLLDLLLVFVFFYVMLRVAGTPEEELALWFYGGLSGFSVGGVAIKPLNILLAILVVVLILLATRLMQRRVRGGFFATINLESSVQQSISTGIGYVGVIAAMLIGVNVLGLDLTNLALIAGALSVGIGFGLQNIVSNFVSGLILLIERPVKVGDWVIVGGNEGVVKRISVRATEIETWQRSSILVPNSDLVSTAVTNWTHKDRIGRVDIAVRVPFDSDPKQVHDLLLASAGKSRDVLRFPAAYVYFRSFSPDGMDFDLRVYVPDIYNLFISVANELRFEIVARFREAGIEMALPQRVVHMAEIERLVPAAAPGGKREPPPDEKEGG